MTIRVSSARKEKVPNLVLCTAFDLGIHQINTARAILPDLTGEKLFFLKYKYLS